MTDFLGPKIIGRFGRLWRYDKDSREYRIDEDFPTLDENQQPCCGLALTIEGYIINMETKEVFDFTPPLKQIITNSNYPFIMGVSVDNQLLKISLRDSTSDLIMKGIIFIIEYRIGMRLRNGNADYRNNSDLIDEKGDRLELILNSNSNEITSIRNEGYIGNENIKREGELIFTEEGVFKMNSGKLGHAPPNIIDGVDLVGRPGYDQLESCMILLDNMGNLYRGFHDGDMNPKQFYPCTSKYIISSGELDPWIRISSISGDEERVALIATSGAVSIINTDLMIVDTNIPIEIFGSKPSKSKNARNKE